MSLLIVELWKHIISCVGELKAKNKSECICFYLVLEYVIVWSRRQFIDTMTSANEDLIQRFIDLISLFSCFSSLVA